MTSKKSRTRHAIDGFATNVFERRTRGLLHIWHRPPSTSKHILPVSTTFTAENLNRDKGGRELSTRCFLPKRMTQRWQTCSFAITRRNSLTKTCFNGSSCGGSCRPTSHSEWPRMGLFATSLTISTHTRSSGPKRLCSGCQTSQIVIQVRTSRKVSKVFLRLLSFVGTRLAISPLTMHPIMTPPWSI